MVETEQTGKPAFHANKFILAQSGRAFFGLLTEKQLKRGIFTSVADLEEKIIAYIDKNNENPKPFVWTKPAEVILGKVSREGRSVLDNI